MSKALRITAVSLAALVGVLVVAGAIVAARFDPDSLKPLLIERMQREHRRTLSIPGSIRLRLFPRIGVQLGALSLSEPDSAAGFAAVRSASVSIALLPLLRREFVVDRIQVDGLRATVTRFKDGRTSIDDLLATPSPRSPAPPPAGPAAPAALHFDVAGVVITDAAITIDDQRAGRRLALTRADIETGRIAPGRAGDASIQAHIKSSQPQLDADLALKSRLTVDPARQRVALDKLAAALSGRLAGFPRATLRLDGSADVALQPLQVDLDGLVLALQAPDATGPLEARVELPRLQIDAARIAAQAIVATASLHQGPRRWQLRLSLPAFGGAARAFQLPAFDGALAVDEGSLHARARLSGSVAGDIEHLRFTSPATTAALDGSQGATRLQGRLALPWSVDLQAQKIDLPHITVTASLPNPRGGTLALEATGRAAVRLDKHNLDASLAGKLDDSRFDARFAMRSFAPAVSHLDLQVDQLDLDRYRSAARPAGAGPAPRAPETPLDLSALRALDTSASLRIGRLRLAGLQTANLRLDLRARDGRLDLNPIAADLYQGRVAGSLAVVASTPPRVALVQNLSGIAVGPLLQDLLGKPSLEGRGDVTLDLTAQGATVGALRKALDGHARIALRDGAVHGVNIAQSLRSASARLGLGGQHAGTGSQAESTDFSDLSGSFVVHRSVAHNDDLVARSPLLRLAGSGDIDLGEGRLDYLVKATLVDTLQGQGGPELQALRGQTVPVRLKGPFDAIGTSIDVAGLARDIARRKLEGKAKDATAKATQKLADKLKGLFGR